MSFSNPIYVSTYWRATSAISKSACPLFQEVEDGSNTGISGDVANAELLQKSPSTNDMFAEENARTLSNTNDEKSPEEQKGIQELWPRDVA